ncbi:MAG: NTP transferase domain-containing protein [Desulfobacterales bacterium]|nr:NTP transferase domain-containing protein [Desulfobacterales bacterium]
MNNYTGIIILAAGKGTRMKSDKAKVLHELCGKPIIEYVVETAKEITSDHICVVIGHQSEAVKSQLKNYHLNFAYQKKQLGTAHAVMCALPTIPNHLDHIIIMCGDVPLIRKQTIHQLMQKHSEDKCTITLLAVNMNPPYGYGRIVVDEFGNVKQIIEEADASNEEKKITMVNSGLYCINQEFIRYALNQIGCNNNQQEMYLTDIIEIAFKEKKKIGLIVSDCVEELIGVNQQDDLFRLNQFIENRKSIAGI